MLRRTCVIEFHPSLVLLLPCEFPAPCATEVKLKWAVLQSKITSDNEKAILICICLRLSYTTFNFYFKSILFDILHIPR